MQHVLLIVEFLVDKNFDWIIPNDLLIILKLFQSKSDKNSVNELMKPYPKNALVHNTE